MQNNVRTRNYSYMPRTFKVAETQKAHENFADYGSSSAVVDMQLISVRCTRFEGNTCNTIGNETTNAFIFLQVEHNLYIYIKPFIQLSEVKICCSRQ